VRLLDGTHVNPTLVQDGWCWWYRKYALGDTVLERLEKDALLNKTRVIPHTHGAGGVVELRRFRQRDGVTASKPCHMKQKARLRKDPGLYFMRN
jgi:hypothetical protein